MGNWQKLPQPPGQVDFYHDIGLEVDGTLWVMAGANTVVYWDGKKYHAPPEGPFAAGQYLTRLIGGAERGLFLTQPGDADHQGKLYRLSDGHAKSVAEFYYEERHYFPGIYISRSGKIFNYGSDFIAFNAGGGWESAEAQLSKDPTRTTVLDNGEAVFFFSPPQLYSIDAQPPASERNPSRKVSIRKLRFKEKNRKQQYMLPMFKAALWGKDRALVLEYGTSSIQAVSLPRGKSLDVGQIQRALGGRDVYDIWSDRSGTVWAMVHDEKKRTYGLARITSNSAVSIVEATFLPGWENHQFFQHPQSALHARDGSYWFGMKNSTVLHLRGDRVELFDQSNGLGQGLMKKILEDRLGRIYALSENGIFLFSRDMSRRERKEYKHAQAEEDDVQDAEI